MAISDEQTATAEAAGAGGADNCEPFEAWAFKQRRRAALDGAWKIEVTERVENGTTIRSVTSWHDKAKQQHTPSRRGQQHGGGEAVRSAELAANSRKPKRQPTRQRRSFLRSAAAHHKHVRLRLRSHMLAVRFFVRLSRLTVAARVLRDALSPGKRRYSPQPPDSALVYSVNDDDAALAPPAKRFEGGLGWMRRAMRRVGFGDG